MLPRDEQRGASVFPAPARETLKAANYDDARRINYGAVGKKIAKQAFNILRLIRDADELLRHDNKARTIVREVHPELCFWAFNGKHPMRHAKKSTAGQDERLAILDEIWPSARPAAEEACKEYLRKEVAKDDIYDAMAAAITAKAEASHSLPEVSEFDSEGLPMQMIRASRETLEQKFQPQ